LSHIEASPSRMTTLRSLMSRRDRVAMLGGAHDVISAKLAECSGCDGIWASSLEIATSRGQIDDDRLTMSDVLSATRSMAAAVSIPILADAGTGWGDHGNVVDVVRAFESCAAAGICIEDTAYPKHNSLLSASRRLTPQAEFAKRVTQACDARMSEDFLIVARVEALIAGLGGDEALNRAAQYEQAGADAIVIHAKDRNCDDVLHVVGAWTGAAPIVLIPTTYPELPFADLPALGNVGMIIYANQGMRAAMSATEKAFRQIRHDGHAGGVERWITPIDSLLDVQRQLIGKERFGDKPPQI
jgi:phosphoenolpyruvate phosphomutase